MYGKYDMFGKTGEVVIGNVVKADEFVINLDDEIIKNPIRIKIMRMTLETSKGRTLIVNTNGKEVPSDLKDLFKEFNAEIRTGSEKPEPIVFGM